MRFTANAKSPLSQQYSLFDLINGEHPYKQLGPQGFIEYQVVNLNKGQVVYFNFELAKEMGLLDRNHKRQMTSELHQKLIDTFSIQIINEYDVLNKKRIAKKDIRPNKYMATRYLQLQHKSKTGTTSGDGRSIWNGYLTHQGSSWDISSRGTGVTMLSPGASKKNKPLKTGNNETGYGCGQAEIDELIGSAIMSEVLHHKGVHTERVLCVIDLGKGIGIGVRAGQNLLRPAHAFLFLKQSKLLELKKVIDYHIERQIGNKKLPQNIPTNDRYKFFLNQFILDLAKFTAFAEENYLFVWLDWDGDNLLMDSGIIDYGSIRHFGTCHNKYKYDDVDRFSTNLKEQKYKAQIIVTEMIQAIDFIVTGTKKPLNTFSNHPGVKFFKKSFSDFSLEFFAQKIGLSKDQFSFCHKDQAILKNLKNLKKIFYFWENLKSSRGQVNVPDGIDYLPLTNMRAIARELPQLLSKKSTLDLEEFIKISQTQFCKPKDEKVFYKNKKQFSVLIKYYSLLLNSLNVLKSKKELEKMSHLLIKVQPENFLTGNSLIHSVDAILNSYSLSKKASLVQLTIDKLVDFTQGPDFFNKKRYFYSIKNESSLSEKKLWDTIIMNLQEYKEDI